jgi:hypothetical protein
MPLCCDADRYAAPICKKLDDSFHTLLHQVALVHSLPLTAPFYCHFPTVRFDYFRCSFNHTPRACVARAFYKLSSKRHITIAIRARFDNDSSSTRYLHASTMCGQITLLCAFPASGPQSTFCLSSRCRRSDEVI